MASTIKIKRSSVAGKKPTTSEITTGELALNTKDQKLFSSNGTSVFEIANAGALANTNAYIATKAPTASPTFTGTLSAPLISVTQALPNEGGQIELALPSSGTTLSGVVAIDIYQNKLRIFETSGTNRGAYIDLTAAGASVGTNLLTGGGSTTQYLQVVNANATFATKAYAAANSYVKSVLANTNSYIAAQATRITLVNTNLLGTNTAIRALDAQKLSVANAVATYATKASPTTSGLLAHTGRATISTNLTVSGNTTVTSTSRIYGFTRTLPTTVGDIVELGNVGLTNGAGLFEISIVVPSSGFSVSKHYIIPANYDETGSGVWNIVSPISGGAYSGQDFQLDVNVAAATASFRIRRTAGGTAGTAYITIKQSGTTLIFTETSATATVTAPTLYYGAASISQVDRRVGIKNLAPSYDIDVTGTGRFTDNLIVSGNTTLGAANKTITSTGLILHTGRATISTNLYVAGNTILGNPAAVTDRTVINGVTVANGSLSVSGNTTLSGTLVANNTSGTAGYYLRTSGTGVYWSPVSAGSSGLVSITTASVKNLTQNDTVVTNVGVVAASGYLQVANAVATYTPKNRVVSYTDQNSITINADTTDTATQSYTGAAGTLTINAPTGTPVDGQKVLFRLTTTNAQTFSWNAIFRGSTDLTLPTTSSGSSKIDYLAFIYNSASTKWDLLAKNFGY